MCESTKQGGLAAGRTRVGNAVIFGRWANLIPTLAGVVVVGGFCGVVGGFWYWATPKFWDVGYMPTQPGTGAGVIGFSHQIHAGKLGLDCRYCHTHVERSAEANVPAVATCIGCHAEGHVSFDVVPDAKVAFVREAYAKDESIPWRRVHKLGDYVRNFPHAAHVNAGVSCFQCHGQITAMPVVYQHEPLSMAWCLDCHRETVERPGRRLVPPERVTHLLDVERHLRAVERGEPGVFEDFDAAELFRSLHLAPPTNCGACHY